MKICMVGTGYVGLVTGTIFAHKGHEIICVDNEEDKIRTLNKGKLPIYEPGLQDLKYGYGVIINGFLMARLQGLKTPLKDGDQIILTTLISGG